IVRCFLETNARIILIVNHLKQQAYNKHMLLYFKALLKYLPNYVYANIENYRKLPPHQRGRFSSTVAGRVSKGISAQASHRTVLEPLSSYSLPRSLSGVLVIQIYAF
ncbi:MAG: hypothetical protein PHU66_06690, partial [Bacteroidaceae bacterium]|nr:hypothetical protein [Bacteroidaceae bacterium]